MDEFTITLHVKFNRAVPTIDREENAPEWFARALKDELLLGADGGPWGWGRVGAPDLAEVSEVQASVAVPVD